MAARPIVLYKKLIGPAQAIKDKTLSFTTTHSIQNRSSAACSTFTHHRSTLYHSFSPPWANGTPALQYSLPAVDSDRVWIHTRWHVVCTIPVMFTQRSNHILTSSNGSA
jgi:hypothetical protein